MKKITFLFSLFFCAMVLVSSSFAATESEVRSKLSKSIVESMKARGLDVIVKIDFLKKMDEPAGYYFMKLTFFDKKSPDKVAGEQYLFSDGNFIVEDFLRAKDMSSIAKDLNFEFSARDLDVSGLTPIIGSVGAKNVIVEVTDFQCPYCIKANEYLHNKLKNRNDVVVYMMHFPLRNMHPKAELLAKIFEAGAAMGKNFGNELYKPSVHEKSEIQLINDYALKSGDEKRFKELVASKEIADKVLKAEAKVKEMNIGSTPTIFINGKMISGFDIPLIDKAISEF